MTIFMAYYQFMIELYLKLLTIIKNYVLKNWGWLPDFWKGKGLRHDICRQLAWTSLLSVRFHDADEHCQCNLCNLPCNTYHQLKCNKNDKELCNWASQQLWLFGQFFSFRLSNFLFNFFKFFNWSYFVTGYNNCSALLHLNPPIPSVAPMHLAGALTSMPFRFCAMPQLAAASNIVNT